MGLTRCRFEIDAVVQVLPDIIVTELKRDAERASGRESAVRIESVAEVVRLPALFELGRPVGADRNHRKSQLRQLVSDFAQLTELRIAIGSPAAAVEDEQRTGVTDELRKVSGRSV